MGSAFVRVCLLQYYERIVKRIVPLKILFSVSCIRSADWERGGRLSSRDVRMGCVVRSGSRHSLA